MSTPSSSPKAVKHKLADNISKNVLRARRSVSQLIGLNSSRDGSQRSLSASRCTPEPPQMIIPAESCSSNKIHNDGQSDMGGWMSSASPSPLSLDKRPAFPPNTPSVTTQPKSTPPRRHNRALTSTFTSSTLTRKTNCPLGSSPALNENSSNVLNRSPSISVLAPTLRVDIPSTSLSTMIASGADEWDILDIEEGSLPVGSVPASPSPLSQGMKGLKETATESPQVLKDHHTRTDSVTGSSRQLENKDPSPHQSPPTPMPGTTLGMDDLQNITPVAEKSLRRPSPIPMTSFKPPVVDVTQNQDAIGSLPSRSASSCHALEAYDTSNTPKSTPSFRPESDLRSEVSLSQLLDWYPDDPFGNPKTKVLETYSTKNRVSTPPSSLTSSPTLGQNLPMPPSPPSEDAHASMNRSPSFSKSSSMVEIDRLDEVDRQAPQTNNPEEKEQQAGEGYIQANSIVSDGS